MRYGVSYYPEHKTEDEYNHDIKLIIESGINTVRMGEFAWCRFEPEEGKYDFKWLDKAVNQLGEAGIKVIICTPTACPPAWMIEKHPDILYMDNRRIRRPFGGRRHYCYNNEDYRSYSAKITEQIARHYGENPYVSGFQIDNEPAQEGTGRCTCPVCTSKFQNWLENKYKTIDEFNRRSGGIFWSQEYTKFSQINPPVNSIEVGAQQQINAYFENPTVKLEFERFSSESQIEYQNIQTRILKEHTNYPVTTNATGLATNSIDNYESTKELDLYAFDYYPGLRDARVDSFPYAFARGVKGGSPFWVLEFMSGGGHKLSGTGRLQPNPGALKQAVLHSFAHGADMMLHFQYRSFPFGAEQLNYSIVDTDGVPRRRYYEMKETAQELKELEEIESAEFVNDTAIVFDYDCHWALRIKPINDPKFNYLNYCGTIYTQLTDLGINTDVISLDGDYSKYKMIVLPAAFILSEKHRDKLKKYVNDGGCLVATFLTSVKNKDNVGYTDTLPAGMTDLFGVTVEEVEPVFDENHTELKANINGESLVFKDSFWSELLSVKNGADVIGEYISDYKSGQAVISENKYGKGRAYYIGTGLETTALKELFGDICVKADIMPTAIKGSDKIEVVHRKQDGKDVYFVFNFSCSETSLSLDCIFQDYLSKDILRDSVNIDRNGYKILVKKE